MIDNSTTESGTPVERLYVRLVRLAHPVHDLTDEARAARCDAIAQGVGALARLPSERLADVERKLAMLSTWLRTEDHASTSLFGLISILLAESARDDVARLAITAGDGPEHGASA